MVPLLNVLDVRQSAVQLWVLSAELLLVLLAVEASVLLGLALELAHVVVDHLQTGHNGLGQVLLELLHLLGVLADQGLIGGHAVELRLLLLDGGGDFADLRNLLLGLVSETREGRRLALSSD